ncbi:MAG: ROK family protein [Clostridia bacterium]|nr:ROK family protein [Clostridia bacterium]
MYIGIDLGGTNIAVGLVDNKGNIVAHASTPTLRERSWTEIVKDMAVLTNKVTASAGKNLADIKVVGIGIPGNIDNEHGVVVRAANLNMENVPLAAEFRKYIDIPVCLENDANAAAFGEYFAQDPRRDNFLMVTLGTGVGGGIVIKGKIFRGFNGAGGEIGHHVVHLNGEKCACGRCGCYETYASVTALINQTKKKMRECPDSMMHKWVEIHGEVSGFTAFDCASKGDKAALEVRDTYITYVAEGIVNLINIFQPEIVVIGGGISCEGDVILKPIREFVAKYEFNKTEPRTQIVTAKLFNDAGIVGAAMAAKKQKFL